MLSAGGENQSMDDYLMRSQQTWGEETKPDALETTYSTDPWFLEQRGLFYGTTSRFNCQVRRVRDGPQEVEAPRLEVPCCLPSFTPRRMCTAGAADCDGKMNRLGSSVRFPWLKPQASGALMALHFPMKSTGDVALEGAAAAQQKDAAAELADEIAKADGQTRLDIEGPPS